MTRASEWVSAGMAGVWSIYNVNPTHEISYLDNSVNQEAPPVTETWQSSSSDWGGVSILKGSDSIRLIFAHSFPLNSGAPFASVNFISDGKVQVSTYGFDSFWNTSNVWRKCPLYGCNAMVMQWAAAAGAAYLDNLPLLRLSNLTQIKLQHNPASRDSLPPGSTIVLCAVYHNITC